MASSKVLFFFLLCVHVTTASPTAFELHKKESEGPSLSPLLPWHILRASDSTTPGAEQRLRGSQEAPRKLLAEPRKAYGLVAPLPTSAPTRANVNASFRWESHVAIPEWVDWRETAATTSVHDQGACGSCWAVAAADAVTMTSRITEGSEGGILEGSAQEICDCGGAIGSCQGGWPETALAYVYATGGLSSRQAYPYTAANNTCQADAIHPQPGLALAGWEAVPARNVVAMKKAVAMGPVIAFINAENLHAYRGGFFSRPCDGAVNHVVLIVGYGTCPTNGLYWIVKNSWGAQWGDNGYLYMKASEGPGTCGITSLQGLFPLPLSLSSPCRGPASPCGAGTCRVEDGLARCTCPPGFAENRQTNPPKCVTADPCAQNPNPCGAGVCENSSDGNYACACNEGHVIGARGDGAPTCVGSFEEGSQTHRIVAGESCEKIALHRNIAVSDFQSWNSWMDCSRRLEPGMVVVVGDGSSTSGCRENYIVENNDTCSSIATKRGVSIQNFSALNSHIGCESLTLGTELCLKKGNLSSTASMNCTQLFEVQKGNTCSDIIESLEISEDDLLRWNPGLSCTKDLPEKLSVCTATQLSEASPLHTCVRWHRVKHGDSCASLWAAARLSADAFVRMNPGVRCFGPYWRVGQLVCLEDALTEEHLGTSLVPYTVQKNDTLTYIAKIMHDSCGEKSSVSAIEEANQLVSGESVAEGKILRIPCGRKLGRTCGCMPGKAVLGDNGIWYTSECDAKCNFALPVTAFDNICKRACTNRAGLPRLTKVGTATVPAYCSSPCAFPQWLPFPYPLPNPADKCKIYISACQDWCSAAASNLGGTSANWQSNFAGCVFLCKKGKCV